MHISPPLPCRAKKVVIQAAAERYAQQIGFRPGSDIFEVVERLGGRIIYKDFFLAPKSESIHVHAENRFDIFVPHETSAARDRFTIAHELGHLLLHYPMVLQKYPNQNDVQMTANRYLGDESSEEERRCEWEANWFSAAFLMPAEPFSKAWNTSGKNLEVVARQFLVSTSAVDNRVKSLQL